MTNKLLNTVLLGTTLMLAKQDSKAQMTGSYGPDYDVRVGTQFNMTGNTTQFMKPLQLFAGVYTDHLVRLGPLNTGAEISVFKPIGMQGNYNEYDEKRAADGRTVQAGAKGLLKFGTFSHYAALTGEKVEISLGLGANAHLVKNQQKGNTSLEINPAVELNVNGAFADNKIFFGFGIGYTQTASNWNALQVSANQMLPAKSTTGQFTFGIRAGVNLFGRTVDRCEY